MVDPRPRPRLKYSDFVRPYIQKDKFHKNGFYVNLDVNVKNEDRKFS